MNDRLEIASRMVAASLHGGSLGGAEEHWARAQAAGALVYADALIAAERESAAAMLHPKPSPPPAGPTEATPPASTPEPGGGDLLPRLNCDQCGARVSSNIPGAMEDLLAYHKEIVHPATAPASAASVPDPSSDGAAGAGKEEPDDLYDEAVRALADMRFISISLLQRQLRTGYNRAARLIERMERAGLVGPMGSDGTKPREVLASRPAAPPERCLAPDCPAPAVFERCCDVHSETPKSIKLEWLRDRAAAEGRPTKGSRRRPKDPGAVLTQPAEGKKRARKIREQVEATFCDVVADSRGSGVPGSALAPVRPAHRTALAALAAELRARAAGSKGPRRG